MSVWIEREAEDLELWEKKREDLKKAGVKYCLAAYVDIHGIAKGQSSSDRSLHRHDEGF